MDSLTVGKIAKRVGGRRSFGAVLSLLTCATLMLTPLYRGVAFAGRQAATEYVCPMDKDVRGRAPGKCPKCGMALRASTGGAPLEPKEVLGAKNDRAGAGLKIPDTEVVAQDGRKLRFFSDLVRGKTVAINFIFTTCTTICPPLTATFRKVQQDLGERVGKEINMISISVDPSTDLPERLKTFSNKFKAGPGWTFVTGSPTEINELLKALGAFVSDKNDHTPMILVGNERAGYWTRTYGLARPSALIEAINEAASKQPASAETREADAPPAKPEGAAKPKTPAEAAAAYFPNHTLLTQDNKPVRFFDDLMKGKTVLINFFFGTCTGVCPPMTANLAKVQEYLGDRVGKEINMISITVDPLIDTPEALKKYAENFKAKPGWYFLTGRKENVDWVLYKVGGYVDDRQKHSNVLIVGNVETGEFIKIFAMSKPAQIVDAVNKVAGPAR